MSGEGKHLPRLGTLHYATNAKYEGNWSFSMRDGKGKAANT